MPPKFLMFHQDEHERCYRVLEILKEMHSPKSSLPYIKIVSSDREERWYWQQTSGSTNPRGERSLLCRLEVPEHKETAVLIHCDEVPGTEEQHQVDHHRHRARSKWVNRGEARRAIGSTCSSTRMHLEIRTAKLSECTLCESRIVRVGSFEV